MRKTVGPLSGSAAAQKNRWFVIKIHRVSTFFKIKIEDLLHPQKITQYVIGQRIGLLR
jgi:hypothetical protein